MYRAVNSTLAIDLSTSWTPSDVTIRKVVKPAPGLAEEVLFVDRAAKTFYIWGGHVPYLAAPAKALWKFVANGIDGVWATDLPADPNALASIPRVERPGVASGLGAGWYLGGFETPSSERGGDGLCRVHPGLMSYNFTTRVWANTSAVPLTPTGATIGSSINVVPGWGAGEGILAFIGGVAMAIGSQYCFPYATSYLSLGNVTLYDPVGRAWYWQATSGDVPTFRENHCSVGVAGPNGTYEM